MRIVYNGSKGRRLVLGGINVADYFSGLGPLGW